ncbi:hypothetical protein RJ640_013057 [Escallonia rubra]|uniref:ATPase V1 complex subunit H C-terminal domain-containing protein n=1 Tax=Escallonia rubra TaxID=112253 RepID=A0AA88QY46_9ASTE|nr:hypothetical protein RJ640_013057 [Escallonia rubra]
MVLWWWWEVQLVAALRGGDGDDIEVYLVQVLRVLLHLLDVSLCPRTLAVACFDLAEFIQYHSYGRAILINLNANKLVMNLLNHENAEAGQSTVNVASANKVVASMVGTRVAAIVCCFSSWAAMGEHEWYGNRAWTLEFVAPSAQERVLGPYGLLCSDLKVYGANHESSIKSDR